MSRELFAVVEQILDDGHMSTETLAQLRAAYEATTPQGEPVKYEFRMRPDWVDRVQWSEWKECTEAAARDYWRYSAGDWIYEARALYTASPPAAPSVPAGWRLVPVEPTQEMRKAGGHANSEWLNDNAPIGESRYAMPMENVYRAMLDAAPEAPEAPSGEEA